MYDVCYCCDVYVEMGVGFCNGGGGGGGEGMGIDQE